MAGFRPPDTLIDFPYAGIRLLNNTLVAFPVAGNRPISLHPELVLLELPILVRLLDRQRVLDLRYRR